MNEHCYFCCLHGPDNSFTDKKLKKKIASLEQNITGANELRKEFDLLLETSEVLDRRVQAYREVAFNHYQVGEEYGNYSDSQRYSYVDTEAAALMAKGEKG